MEGKGGGSRRSVAVANALAQSELLATFDPEAFSEVAKHVKVRRLRANRALVESGDEATDVFVLLDGQLEVVVGRNGTTQRVATLDAGAVVGEIGLLGGDRRSATVRALSPSEVAVIPSSAFESLLADNPDAAEALATRALDRLRTTQLISHFSDRFGVFDADALALVESLAEWVHLRAGETLFREGDDADAGYLVATGRLRAVRTAPDGQPEILGDIARSELVGEVALVDGEPRTASVHAVRDSHLIRFTKQGYEQLLDHYPRVGLEVAKLALARTRRSATRARRAAGPRSFAVLPISGSVDAQAFIDELTTVLGPSVQVLSSTSIDEVLGRPGLAQVEDDGVGAVRLSYHLEEEEARHQHLVYQLDPEWTTWSRRAVRSADHIVLVAGAAGDPAISEHEQALWTSFGGRHRPDISLVLLHDPATTLPSGTMRWLEHRDLAAHHHVRRGDQRDLARLGRLLTGVATSIVLGGGGARGFAHLGVLEVLEDLGKPIDMVGGTSIGAIMGVCPAMGWDAATSRERAVSSFRRLMDPTLPTTSLLRGRRITRALRTMLGDTDIADLWIPYYCVSTNLTTATLEVHDRGPLVEALRASIAIPGVLPPVPRDGDLLVDGGLLDNVPVDEMRRRNPTGQVVAVDVAPAQGPVAARDYGLSPSGFRALVDRRRGQGPPHLLSTMVRATLLSSVRDRQRVVDDAVADLYLDVSVEGGNLLDFSEGTQIAAAAAESTRRVLGRWSTGEDGEVEPYVQTEPIWEQPDLGKGRGVRGIALLTLRDLQHRSARVASVIVGTAVVLTLLFLMSGLVEQFHREPRDTIANLGADRWMVPEGASGAFTRAAISPEEVADAVEGADAAPIIVGREVVTVDGQAEDVVVIGYEPGGLGEPDLPEGVHADGPGELVIDESAGADVGETVEMGGTSYEVTGHSEKATMFAGMPIVFVPIESAQALLYRGQPLISAVLLDGEASSLPEGFHTLSNEEIAVDAMRPLERSVSSVNLIRVLLWFVAAMIIGTMTYLAALERLRDMAVLKAIGAKTGQLATSIALQGVLIALVAALLAAGLQVLVVPVFPLAVSVPAEALWQVPVIAVLVALLAGVVGLRKAVRVDPALAFAGPGA